MIAEDKAKKLLKEWQTRLKLDDWVIVLEPNCRIEDMANDDCAGCCDWTESGKAAKIQILDEQYYGNRIVPFDFEKTLVHELLHAKLSLVSENVCDLQERYMHQIIDDMAKAFVEAKRAK